MYLFKIVYGDPGRDGHNLYSDFQVRSSHCKEDILKALNNGQVISGLDLNTYLSAYEDRYLPIELYSKLIELGYDSNSPEEEDYIFNGNQLLIELNEFDYILLFLIKLGNPEINIEINNELETINLGYGYGLFLC